MLHTIQPNVSEKDLGFSDYSFSEVLSEIRHFSAFSFPIVLKVY